MFGFGREVWGGGFFFFLCGGGGGWQKEMKIMLHEFQRGFSVPLCSFVRHYNLVLNFTLPKRKKEIFVVFPLFIV